MFLKLGKCLPIVLGQHTGVVVYPQPRIQREKWLFIVHPTLFTMEAVDHVPQKKKVSWSYWGFSRPGRWQVVFSADYFHRVVPKTCSYSLCLPMLPLHHTILPPKHILKTSRVLRRHLKSTRSIVKQCKNSLYRVPFRCLTRILLYTYSATVSQGSLFCHWVDLTVRKYFPIPSIKYACVDHFLALKLYSLSYLWHSLCLPNNILSLRAGKSFFFF